MRSAVYIGEQECPYEEEFDGNDLAATHLIGYVGNEPAGCPPPKCAIERSKLNLSAIAA